MGGFTRKLYVDFSRDILYRNSWLHDFLAAEFPITFFRANSGWTKDTELLAVRLNLLDSLSEPSGSQHRERAEEALLKILASFPKLKTLRLVAEGRDVRISGPHELIDMSDQSSDALGDSARKERAEQKLATLLDPMKAQNPDISMPALEFALIVNGNGHPAWERQWTFTGTRCEIRAVGSSDWQDLRGYREGFGYF